MRTLRETDASALDAAAAALRAGEVIVVPTDTVYGLAALPDIEGAAHRIYLAKDRPAHLQLPVLAASLDQVRALGVEFTAAATTLAARWWPGPLTLAFGFSPAAARPPWLAGRDEVAVRIPQNDFLLALLRATGPLLVTSANRHGEPTPASARRGGAAARRRTWTWPSMPASSTPHPRRWSTSARLSPWSTRGSDLPRRAVASALGMAQADGA